jgi:hypothetical protein
MVYVVLVTDEAKRPLRDQLGDSALFMALGAALVAFGQCVRFQNGGGPVTLGALGRGLMVIFVTRLARSAGGVERQRHRFPMAVDALLVGVRVVQEIDRPVPGLVVLNRNGEDHPIGTGKVL